MDSIDAAYAELDDIQQGLADALGITWGSPTAIGPAPCSTDPADHLEVWLDRPASSDQPIAVTLDLARDYLRGRGLDIDPQNAQETRDDVVIADRVIGRRGHFLISVRAATNGSVTVSGVLGLRSGDWSTTGWVPPSE